MAINFRKVIEDPKKAEEMENEFKEAILNAISPPTPFIKNKNYLIRTITMCDVGRCVEVVGNFLIMENASWIADTGRFNECLVDPLKFNQIEPFKHPIYINLNAIVDATPYPYELPLEPK